MNKCFKKSMLTASVTVGLMFGSLAHADSLLAPFVVSDAANGINTFFAMKMRGNGAANQQMGVNSPVHYTYIRKRAPGGFAADIGDLFNNQNGCDVENSSGNGSPWDMILQDANGRNVISDPFYLNSPTDASAPSGYPAAIPFYGMWIIDDTTALAGSVSVGEGDSSGFVYVIDRNTGDVFDYKLLNNHRSKASGDFSSHFISKQSIDHMWMPATIRPLVPAVAPLGATPGVNVPVTLQAAGTIWYTAVTGMGMTNAAETDGGWNHAVNITQANTARIIGRPQQDILPIFQVNPAVAAGPGVYDNDETVISGRKDTPVTCLGMYTSEDLQTPSQVLATTWGGWKRSHINVTTPATANGAQAEGAITYRFDNAAALGLVPSWTMQIETSGHLNNGALGAHPNRPY